MDRDLLIVGGYGLVGRQAAAILRARDPGLRLTLAGRSPGAAEEVARACGASTATVDVRRPRPLADLAEPPGAILATVSDPRNELLADAVRHGIPFADITRSGAAAALDAAVCASDGRATAPVLLAGSLMAGLSASAAALAVAELGGADRIDITMMGSSDDRVGPDSWDFSRRLAWTHHPMREGEREASEPLSRIKRVRCPDGVERPGGMMGTVTEATLPLTLGVPTVEARLAFTEPPVLLGLVALKRLGLLSLLENPLVQRIRNRGAGEATAASTAGLSVTARRGGRAASVDILDERGQSHLSAVGAVNAAERLLGGGLPAGVSFPEQSGDHAADLAAAREAGVSVRFSGFAREAVAPLDGDRAAQPAGRGAGE